MSCTIDYVLVVNSKTLVCLDEKGGIYFSNKEDATVKIIFDAEIFDKQNS